MFSTLLDKMGPASRASACVDLPRASSPDSLNSTITVDHASNAQSSSSTPPTSIGDSASVSSTSLPLDNARPTTPEEPSGRKLRARKSVDTYNVKVLAGTAIHAPKRHCKDQGHDNTETRRRTISGETLVGALASGNVSTESVQKDAERLVRDGIDALDLHWSVKALPKSRSQIGLGELTKTSAKQEDLGRRKSMRLTGGTIESLTKKLSVLGKRGRKTFEDSLSKAKRELRNLADTNEYAHIDTTPVLHEVWSNGKLVTGNEPPKKKMKLEEPAAMTTPPGDDKPVETKRASERKEKVWLNKGLYAGQEGNLDRSSGFSDKEKEKMASEPAPKANRILPLPMWNGQRLLHVGRNFKLPYDVCSPLPPGQPKPDEWRKSTRNRFVGDAAAAWKKSTLFDSFSSKCICTPQTGCNEDCQNRIMLYECDDTNCAAGRERCTNRAFADLQERRKGGGKYRIGVEVIKTVDRGYGVRSNRSFEPHQIIVEYTGEIITEEECDRRMNEVYKNNDCYYLMAFDQNMIIDATTGSIARFVNHSCKPNCRMVKWIVAGKPRMALFAGDAPIMTGDELTYDYNFDPFSAKNVQECRCGSDNCRGILGPRPKDQKGVKESIKEVVKAGVHAGKRKLTELLGGDEGESSRSPKKRKLKEVKGIKRTMSSVSLKVAKGAANAIKKSVSTQLSNARHVVSSKSHTIVVKKPKASLLKNYGKGQTKLSSRNSSLTIVPASPKRGKDKGPSPRGKSITKNVVRGSSKSKKGATPRAVNSRETIRVISVAGEE